MSAGNIRNKAMLGIRGREVHEIPNSLRNKPKPSDKPTKILGDFAEGANLDFADTPGTTVLGMDDFFGSTGLDGEDNVEENSSTKEKQVKKVVSEKAVKDKPHSKKTKSKKTIKDNISAIKEALPASKKLSSVSNKKNVKSAKKQASKKIEKPVVDEPTTVIAEDEISEQIPNEQPAKFYLVRKIDGEVVKIAKDNFVVGKSKYSDYQVTRNNTVSRSHVIIHKTADGNLLLEDNGSKNGTFVDGARIDAHKKVELSAGQSVRMSDEIFEVKKA